MSIPRAMHGTFTIERRYEATPARVFAAFADPAVKARWFIGPPESWKILKRELDFRVGGSELLQGRFEGKIETLYTARYHEILKDRRIVLVYDMHVNAEHHSVSIATIEMTAEGTRTLLSFTEQVVFLDGTDGRAGTASRERGTTDHLDRLGEVLTGRS
ncbi:MAG TPA: SRPBCC family protein [Candidatus Udaeobacter sp.]|nr:SRPBCC family protein [Candidatus Udaeobacter sp.]